MYQKKSGIDIIGKILDACYTYNPNALFVMSLMHQYEERGSLSKKQLEGLLSKAKKVKDMPQNWLGTLEAIILKMPTRYKSEEPIVAASVYEKGAEAGKLIESILSKYPEHKRVLYLQLKYNNREQISQDEINELKRFYKALKIND